MELTGIRDVSGRRSSVPIFGRLARPRLKIATGGIGRRSSDLIFGRVAGCLVPSGLGVLREPAGCAQSAKMQEFLKCSWEV